MEREGREQGGDLTISPQGKGNPAEGDLGSILGYGNYQHFQIWVLQTLIALIGAINYYHIVFMVSDPPDWQCADSGVAK
jgi:hypothetical protein